MKPAPAATSNEPWGTKVAHRREVLDLNQRELAEACGLRVTQQTISRIEASTLIPRPGTMELVAAALGCRVEELFPWSAWPATRAAYERATKKSA